MGKLLPQPLAPWKAPATYSSNPLKYVRQTGCSTKEHTILPPIQAMAIIGYLPEPMRTMALLDASTGLRASGLTGLRWDHIDFNADVLHIRRGVVYSVVGETKTDASRSQLPLAPWLIETLLAWRKDTSYANRQTGSSQAPDRKGRSHVVPTLCFAGE